MQPLALFLRKEPGGLSSISTTANRRWFLLLRPLLHLVRMIFHAEMGEAAFIEAVMRVRAQAGGGTEASQLTFKELRHFTHDPPW